MTSAEMTIGINVGKAIREDRGISVYTRNVVAGFNQAGPDCRFILLHYPGNAPEDKFGMTNADLEPIPYSEKHGPIQTIINEQILNPLQQKRLGLDVVWQPHNRCQLFAPCAYVATMHDVLPISQPELAGQYLDSRGKKALYLSRTRTAVRADMIITGSEFSKREIINHLGVDADRVKVIYHGIDRNVFRPNRGAEDWARIKANYSLPDRYLLATGSYAPHKNLRALVDAFYQSDLPRSNVGLVMVGPNDATGYMRGYQQIAEYVGSLGLSDKVRLLSPVPQKDLVAIYSNAVIFAITSLYEGFGLTPLEAMACEVPVVASSASAIPEVCGSAALYVHPQDSQGFANYFSVLLKDDGLRERMVSKGRVRVSIFDWTTTARETLNVLRDVATTRKKV
jgi:glycosyltransferase involved in cell wall biosynthesis